MPCTCLTMNEIEGCQAGALVAGVPTGTPAGQRGTGCFRIQVSGHRLNTYFRSSFAQGHTELNTPGFDTAYTPSLWSMLLMPWLT